MFSIESCSIPDEALLNNYTREGTYTDCYVTDINAVVSLAQFITAFYTTPLFRLERFILKIAVSRPSTDAQAKQLAVGSIDTFAAWNVEARGKNQLLMSDFHRRTRSWLMVAPASGSNGTAIRLLFGSAVVPVKHSTTGQAMNCSWSNEFDPTNIFDPTNQFDPAGKFKLWSGSCRLNLFDPAVLLAG